MAKKITKKTNTPKTKPASRDEIAQMFHVPLLKDGHHVLQIPGRDGGPFEIWPGPFNTERGARLFLDTLIDCYADGSPEEALRYQNGCQGYDEQAGVLTFLELQDTTNLRALASEFCRLRPWQGFTGSNFDDVEIPF